MISWMGKMECKHSVGILLILGAFRYLGRGRIMIDGWLLHLYPFLWDPLLVSVLRSLCDRITSLFSHWFHFSLSDVISCCLACWLSLLPLTVYSQAYPFPLHSHNWMTIKLRTHGTWTMFFSKSQVSVPYLMCT
jgi:hypothetical protein